MSVILTGNLAMLLLRFGAVDPLEPLTAPADEVLDRATLTNDALGRIGNSLQFGAASRWLKARGFDLMEHCTPSGDDGADSPSKVTDRFGQEPLIALPPAPPLEFVVGRKTNPRSRDRVKVHHCSLALSSGFLLPVREELDFGPDVFIVHPAVCLVIAASGLSLPETVEYGMGLCGSYALADEDSWRCVYDVPPLTRRDRLYANAAHLARLWDDEHHGSANPKRPMGLSKCLKALDLILDRSASPMESKVATLLTFGSKQGGYGFRHLALNRRYDLSEAQRALVGSPSLLVDGWFDAARVGFEYDGLEFRDFLGKAKLGRDERLVEAAALDGVRILTITRDVLFDPGRFDRFCWELRELLGIRQRAITDQTRCRRDELRATLHLPVHQRKQFASGEWTPPQMAA